jgi:serine/threonine protein kinase
MDSSCNDIGEKYNNKDNLYKNIKGYSCIKRIGSGSFGRTFLFKKGNKKLAVKEIFEEKDTIKEVEALQKIKKNCKNALCHKKVVDNFLITEYIDGSDMWQYYYDGNVKKIEQTYDFILQLFKALEEIHKIGVVHLDIKPENIMISKNKLKLIDFGGAYYSKNKKEAVLTTYTRGYIPENVETRMPFKTAVFLDYYAAISTFRNDNPTFISPLTKTPVHEVLYKLFDSSNLTINNYKKRVRDIKKFITS